MTVTHLPNSPRGNKGDVIVAAYLAAIEQNKEARSKIDRGEYGHEVILAEAALSGMLETVCNEMPSSEAGHAVGMAVALHMVNSIIEGLEDRQPSSFDVYDHILLERLRVLLNNLWRGTDQPPEIAPIAEHLGVEMARQPRFKA
jgi:hypothetical protein